MNGWLWCAAALAVALVPLAVVCVRSPPEHGLVALEAAGMDATLALLLLSEGLHRQPFGDLALVLAVVGFVGALAFVRYVEALR